MVAARPILVLFLLITLTACSGSGGNDGYDPLQAKYFTGTEGVVANFDSFPANLYYFGPGDPASNEFSFGVEMRNEGASFSRGGIYISGFDPTMLEFREIPLFKGVSSACGLSFGTIGFGQLGAIFRCDGVTAGLGEGGQGSFRADNLLKSLSDLTARWGGTAWWDDKNFDLSVDAARNEHGDTQVNLGWTFGSSQLEYYQHGRLFIAIMSSLDFIKNGGREFFLAGDTYEYPGGEYAYYTYNGKIVSWPTGLDETRQKFLLTTCYQYTTFASPITCIDPEPYSDNKKVCVAQSRSYGGGNGAPVAIRSIEQENTPRKIIFHINIENLGNGRVYDPGSLEKCSPYYPGKVTPADLNLVWLGDVRLGDRGLEGRGGPGGIICSPNPVRLDPSTGRGTTTCTWPIEYANLKSAYQSPLTVELWYGYEQSVERELYIKRVV